MPKYRVKGQVKANLNLWLNDLFLRDGFYSNVSVGQLDNYARDLSQLTSTTDESFVANTTFQSAFKNWVHESGVTPNHAGIQMPLVASGVTVDSVFYSKDPLHPSYIPAFAHQIDHPNGRIIFNSPIAAGSNVQAEFTYKEIFVDNASTFENEEKEFYFETTAKDNPQQTGVIVYPEPNSRTAPLVLIDMLSRSSDGYELGSASNVATLNGSFIVWTRDEYMLDQIEDLVAAQEHVVLLGINFNTAAQPLTRHGDKNPAFTSYNDLANLYSSDFWRRIYIDELDARRLTPYYNMERNQITFTIRVYPNF